MYCENRGRKMIALVLAAVMIVLVLTGCGDGKNGTNGKNGYSSPEEYYRHVETAAIADSIERFAEGYDDALRLLLDDSGRKIETETTLELFKPAEDMLETYTGMDFSWLQKLGITANMNLAEDGTAMELALSLNGRDLIGVEVLADVAGRTLYGRVPLLSEDYFSAAFDEMGLYGVDQTVMGQREDMLDAMPDGRALAGLLTRCVEAALERVENVEQGSDTLEAGGVSAKYTTLTVTLGEDDLQDMVEDICKILKKDEDIENYFLYMEDQAGTGLYDDFLDALDELPDDVELDDDIVMTLYVDDDDAIRGRVIEYGDYVLRYAMPEDGGEFGFEMSLEDTDEDEILWIVSGDGERDGNILNGTLVFEADETEMFTISIEDLDAERRNNGLSLGRVTVMPTYEYYTYFGVYSLTARALEDFSYTLAVEEDGVAFEVYMDGEPFLTLTVRAESGPAEELPVISGAKDINRWAQSLSRSLMSYLNYLKDSDLPPELLNQLLGSMF